MSATVDAAEFDSRTRALFFLRVLHYVSIEMRGLLAEDSADRERLKTLTQVTHRVLPVVEGSIADPNDDMDGHANALIEMLDKVGLSGVVNRAVDECQKA